MAAMARFFAPGELGSIESAQRQRAVYQQWAASVNSPTAINVSALAGSYPHMSPGTVLALGRAGVTPDHPVAQHAAKAEAKRRGFGWHSFGDLVSGAVGAVGHVAQNVPGAEQAYDVTKGVARNTMAVLSLPGQAGQAAFREESQGNWGRSKHSLLDQTDLGQILHGKDTGSGFFVGDEAHAAQVQATRQAAPLIDGHAVTMGRSLAHQVFEPGTRSYSVLSGLVDATESVLSDPTTFVGGPTRHAVEGRKLFTAGKGIKEVTPVMHTAGGVNGARKTVLPEKVAEWLDSKQGRQVRQYLTDETDFERMRKATGNKIDVQTLVALKDAGTDEEVLSILGPKLGVDIREKFGVSKTGLQATGMSTSPLTVTGATVRKRLDGVRMLGQMPGTHLDLEDADLAVETLDRFARNVKMPAEQIGVFTEAMARATDRNGRLAVLTDMLGHVRDDVLDTGKLPSAARKQLTRMYDDYDETLRAYAVNELGENALVPGAMIDGAGKALPSPHLYNEYVNRAVPLPDARELRRATSSMMQTISKVPGGESAFRSGTALADFITQTAFKPLVLLRGAWTVRVVGEEQIRMAASGMTSMVAHPLSHIAMAMGRKGNTDITGGLLENADEFRDAMSRGSAGFKDSRVIYTKHRRIIDRDHPQFHEAITDEIGKMADDPVMRRVLNGLGPGDAHPNPNLTGLDAVKDWFFNGAGSKFRQEMAHAGQGSGQRRTFFDVQTNPADPLNSADGYIDSLVQRAKDMTGGDATLMDAVSTGAINGKPLSVIGANGARGVNRDAMKELEDHLTSGAGPNFAPADLVVHVKNGAANEVLRVYDKAVETMFNTLMSRPTNYLSRSPAFKQYYWKRMSELVGFMDPQVQQVALDGIREAGTKQAVRKATGAARGNAGKLTAAEADMLAKAYALDTTKKLLYDLTDRSQFFDITRTIFPFGEAWKEVATVWARIGVQNPVVAHRAQQLITGLRAADTNGDGQGFFHTDPQTGEEVFAYPFTGWISEKLTGVPAPLKAPAKGLNLFSSSVLPGFGPVVQVPVGKVLPDRPEYDWIRGMVIPYGETDTSGGVVESMLPAWAKKLRIAMDRDSPAQDRQYLNTVMDVSRYLVSTGKYSMDSPEEQDRLLQEAKKQARRVYGIRALAQFFVPSPPSPEFVVKDKDGNALLAIKLVEEYRKLQDEDYHTATQKFVEKFGEGALLTTVSKTTGGTSPTDNAYDFMRSNPDVVRQYRDVYGYFVPRGGAFNSKAYQLELETGERKPITPEQAVEIANQRLGQMIYQQAKTKVGKKVSKSERMWLSNVREAIEEQYPGFNTTPANLRDQKLLINQMVRAADNPVLSATDAGQGLRQYLRARDEALQIAKDRGLTSFAAAKKAKDIRAGLRSLADQIAEEHPDFGELFDRTFNREMVSDDGD